MLLVLMHLYLSFFFLSIQLFSVLSFVAASQSWLWVFSQMFICRLSSEILVSHLCLSCFSVCAAAFAHMQLPAGDSLHVRCWCWKFSVWFRWGSSLDWAWSRQGVWHPRSRLSVSLSLHVIRAAGVYVGLCHPQRPLFLLESCCFCQDSDLSASCFQSFLN